MTHNADSDRDPDAEGPDEGGHDPVNPLAEYLAQFGLHIPGSAEDLSAMLGQLQQAFTSLGAPPEGVDWRQAKQATRTAVAALGPDPTPDQSQRRQVADAARLAELWLDAVTSFPATGAAPLAWSRADWVEQTMDAWRTIVEPIVTAIADALAATLTATVAEDEVPGMAQMGQVLAPMLRTAAGSIYALQLSQAIAKLAGTVVSGTEIGLQVLEHPAVAILPTNLASFAEGLQGDPDDVLLYVSLREAARQRLFSQVPWLAPQILALLEHYAREIRIDAEAMREAFDIGNPEELTAERLAEASEALQGRLFEPTQSPEQVEILGRLEVLLALVEGWVDVIAREAAGKWLTEEAALSEAVRRRRATGGAAQTLLRTLVGLEIRPRRVRDAANLWAALGEVRGQVGRDKVWDHPDLIPTAADLDDPLGFVNPEEQATQHDEIDQELQRLLDEYGHQDPPQGS